MTGPAIYYIECTKNGKRYIGSTSCDAKNRMSNHRFRLRKGTHVNKSLQEDWNSFGEAAFNFVMLGTYPLGDVVKEEERIGLEWGCFSPETGYNMVRPVNIHTYDNLNGYRKFTGRTKGPEKVVFKRRVTSAVAEELDRILKENGDNFREMVLLGAREPEVPTSFEAGIKEKATLPMPTGGPGDVLVLLDDIQRLTDQVASLEMELEECRLLTYDEKMAYWKARALKAEAYGKSKDESQ